METKGGPDHVVADALAQRADTLAIVEGMQSNHMRHVAAVGARLGLRVGSKPEHRDTALLERADITNKIKL